MSTVYTAVPLQSNAPWIAGEQCVAAFYFTLSAGFVLGDTVILPNAIPPAGVQETNVMIYHPALDTNATPVGTYDFGDNRTIYTPATLSAAAFCATDSFAEARYMLNAPMGKTGGGSGGQVVNFTNVAPSFASPPSNYQQNGNGYLYQQSSSFICANQGYWNGVLTVTTAPATAATTGTMYFYVYYNCVGLLS
jgi:hypothetical protein